jgi:hypothetical protein
MTDTHLLDDHEAGDILRMLPSRVSRLARRGIIPHVALPDGELRYLATDLMEWAAQHRRASDAQEADRR